MGRECRRRRKKGKNWACSVAISVQVSEHFQRPLCQMVGNDTENVQWYPWELYKERGSIDDSCLRYLAETKAQPGNGRPWLRVSGLWKAWWISWGSKEKENCKHFEKASNAIHWKEKQRVASKKQKILAEPKLWAPKKRKSSTLAPIEAKVEDPPEKIAGTSSSSSIGVTEILKVMTEPFLFAMLSPLGLDLTSLL